MYHPGGATLSSPGITAFSVFGGTSEKGTSTRRCVLLNECVVIPARIKLIHLIGVACGD